MKAHEWRHKESSNAKGKADEKSKSEKKSKSLEGEVMDLPKVDSQRHGKDDDDTTGRMSFSIDFWLAEGEVQGRIIHRPTGKGQEFSASGWTTKIPEFLKKYLSNLEKSIARRPVGELFQQTPKLAEAKQEEKKETSSRKMQTLSFGVFIKDTNRPTRLVQKEQPFEYKWHFKPPASIGIEGEELNYKVNICRKNLADGKREIVADDLTGYVNKETDFREPLIVRPSNPLSAGTYRLEGEATFQSSKSKKPASSFWCKESCVIMVV